jgi:hypothetical protein
MEEIKFEYTGDWYDLTVLDLRARTGPTETARIFHTCRALNLRREEVRQPLVEWMGKLVEEMEGIGDESLPLMRKILASLEEGPEGVTLLTYNIHKCWV